MSAAPALQAQGLRQEDVLRAELRPGWREADGRQIAALHLQLAPHWKTYWRSPGDAGLPPDFDWSGSSNVAAVKLHWPQPRLFDFQGMQTIGYTEDVVIPVEVTPADLSRAVDLHALVALGVCNDVCMPAELRLEADLPMPGAPDPLIRAALADQPLTAEAAGLRALRCEVAPISDGLRVTARMELPPGQGAETVVMEPEHRVWVSDAIIAREGDRLTATADLVPPKGQPFDLRPETLRLTVLSEGRAVEVTGCPEG